MNIVTAADSSCCATSSRPSGPPTVKMLTECTGNPFRENDVGLQTDEGAESHRAVFIRARPEVAPEVERGSCPLQECRFESGTRGPWTTKARLSAGLRAA